MADLDKLRDAFEKAEQDAHKIQADKDDAIAKVRDRYGDKLRDANDKAAAAQKELADAEAAHALVGRDDAETVAANLGLTLPDQD